MANSDDVSSVQFIDESWPHWAWALLMIAACALCAGGIVGAIYAKQSGSLLLGLIAAALGVLLLANLPGPTRSTRAL